MSNKPTLLLVDDESGVLDSLTIFLRGQQGYRVRACQSVEEAFEVLSEQEPQIVLTDISIQGKERGLEVLERARHLYPGIPVVLMSAVASRATAIAAVNSQANYFLEKPFQNQVLAGVLRQALASASGGDAHPLTPPPASKAAASRRHNHPGRASTSELERSRSELIGTSDAFKAALRLVERAAARDVTVLLEGESGVGKTLLAEHLHRSSARAGQPFLTVNCGALAETLLESLLFGHVKGAFTGADRDREGLVRAAHQGTLFLDEVGELSPATQVKLLRVIQEREVLPVGSTAGTKVDVRFVAATNRDLRTEVAAGRFREDLFWRLCVMPIRVPSLRERRDDIPALAESALARIRERDPSVTTKGFSKEALARLSELPWRGNVRELENAVEYAVVTAGEVIDVSDIPVPPEALGLPISREGSAGMLNGPAALPSLALVERAYAEHVVGRMAGDIARAARTLGMPASGLKEMLGSPLPDTPAGD